MSCLPFLLLIQPATARFVAPCKGCFEHRGKRAHQASPAPHRWAGQMKAHTTLAPSSLASAGAYAPTYSTAAKPRVLQISIGIIGGMGRLPSGCGSSVDRGVGNVDGLDIGGAQDGGAHERRKTKLQHAAIFSGDMSVGGHHGAHSSTQKRLSASQFRQT